MTNEEYFHTRFAFTRKREILWQTLCLHYFSGLISREDCVLELGAGYGYFINHIAARRKIAIDSWSGFIQHLHPEVEGRVGDITDLSFLEPKSVNVVFASNVFEHISQEDLASILRQLRPALVDDGTLHILQPNYYYSYREYFDDYTHRTVYSHLSIRDFLEAHGYKILECRPRFLPLTLESRFPVSPLLIRLYLASPWKLFGKQMFIRAQVRKNWVD